MNDRRSLAEEIARVPTTTGRRRFLAATTIAGVSSLLPALWAGAAKDKPATPRFTSSMVATNGITMHIVEQGTEPLVLLVHGSPNPGIRGAIR